MVHVRASKQRTEKQHAATMRNWSTRLVHAHGICLYFQMGTMDRRARMRDLIQEELDSRCAKKKFTSHQGVI